MTYEERRSPHNYPVEQLLDISWRLSDRIIEMTTRVGSGHPSSSLSAIDILTAL